MTIKTKAKKATAVATPPEIHRKLSDVFLINTALFDPLSTAAKTKLLSGASGLPVEFLPNFVELKSARRLTDALLAGKDISRQLEFNGIELTAEERETVRAIGPVLAKINAIAPSYPWLSDARTYDTPIKVRGKSIDRGGYTMTKIKAKRIWEAASKFWSGGPVPSRLRHRHHWEDKTISFTDTEVKIGCQHISRSDIEKLAKEMNWEPVMFNE